VPADEPGSAVSVGAAASPRVEPILTARLELASMSVPFMQALQARDFEAAELALDAAVPRHMADDLEHFIEYRLGQLEVDPTIIEWLGRVMVLTDASGARRVIGSLGFHGPPDSDGRVEMGYRVHAEYRRQGFAAEGVAALFDWAAREHGITRFRASVAPDNVASRALIARFGFHEVGSQMDEIDGLELVFETEWPAP
jgi:RimJ/RimL family protein N-acetyltransferase